jgi:hypothetical protein
MGIIKTRMSVWVIMHAHGLWRHTEQVFVYVCVCVGGGGCMCMCKQCMEKDKDNSRQQHAVHTGHARANAYRTCTCLQDMHVCRDMHERVSKHEHASSFISAYLHINTIYHFNIKGQWIMLPQSDGTRKLPLTPPTLKLGLEILTGSLDRDECGHTGIKDTTTVSLQP